MLLHVELLQDFVINVKNFLKEGKWLVFCWFSVVISYTLVLLETKVEYGRQFVLSVSKERHEVRAQSFLTGAV